MNPVIIVVLGIIGISVLAHLARNHSLRRQVLGAHHEFISSDEFHERWADGLKYREQNGCYALFFYEKQINPYSLKQRKRFKTLYVGQSKDLFFRVHEHFSGRGNDGVMRLLNHGTPAYAVFLPCGLWRMNEYEKALIKAFRANRNGLNIQAGGGKER